MGEWAGDNRHRLHVMQARGGGRGGMSRRWHVPRAQITGDRGWVCKEQVPPGLDCFGQEVVNLSTMIGSSQDRRMDRIPMLAPMSQGVQLSARLECTFSNQNKTIMVHRAWLIFLIVRISFQYSIFLLLTPSLAAAQD
uniref:Uncharacterized protein n=1 Tax=Pipistrellus kuhlii TaxID=59472 RepID=A0A7J7ZKD9_PIPKU|nr:hypothetical protein mPipKuh1_009419 [Pipistrellus kuhlii]